MTMQVKRTAWCGENLETEPVTNKNNQSRFQMR